MSEAQSEHPETPSQAEQAPARLSVGEFADQQAEQQAAVKAKFGEAMTEEDGHKKIGEALLLTATDGAEGEALLGPYLEHEAFPEKINRCLWAYQCKKQSRRPDYDITQEPPKRLARILEKELGRQSQRDQVEAHVEAAQIKIDDAAEHAEAVDAHEDETEKIVATAETYREAVESLGDLPNDQKITALLSDKFKDAIPASERAKLQAFSQILTLADQFPQDAPVIRQRLNQLDMSQSVPSHINFIQTAIFSAPDHDSGVSEAFQTEVAAEFKLTPHRIVTGTDYANAMAETRPDEDGNQVPVFSEKEPLDFGVGVAGYPSANGQEQFMEATPKHGHPWKLNVTKLTPVEKGIAASLLGTWAMMEDAGETDFLIDVTKIDLSVTNAIDPLTLIQTAKIINGLYGGRTGYNGEIVRGGDKVGITRWQAQLRSPKGDAARSDRNASMTDDALQGLGIRDENGKIDIDVLQAFGDYSRDNWFGAPEYENVRDHLAKLFPEKFVQDQD